MRPRSPTLAYFFNRAVTTLKSPDSKTGDVDYSAAYADFVKASNLDSDNKSVQYNAGWTAEQMGQSEKAEGHYRKALELDPTYEAALFNLANLLSGAGRHAEAVDIYNGYLSAKPGDISIWNTKVDAMTQAGQFDQAITEAQLILQTSPDNVPAYRNLSRAYFAKGELGMSQLAAEKAKSLQEGGPWHLQQHGGSPTSSRATKQPRSRPSKRPSRSTRTTSKRT